MSLAAFDVRGAARYDEVTGEVLREGDPERSLVRYAKDGREVFVAARVNESLLAAAARLPVVELKPDPPAAHVLDDGQLLTPEGSVHSDTFLERICEDVTAEGRPACYLAESHGHGRRDFWFVTEDVLGFEAIARRAAGAAGLRLEVHHRRLADVAPTILPTEAIGDLGLELPADMRTRRTRFEFTGTTNALAHLRDELERRGFSFLEVDPDPRELRVAKEVPIDGPGFSAVLREVVPLARSVGCSYRGTETLGGHAQFLLTRPLPSRYAAVPRQPSGWRRLFGGGR